MRGVMAMNMEAMNVLDKDVLQNNDISTIADNIMNNVNISENTNSNNNINKNNPVNIKVGVNEDKNKIATVIPANQSFQPGSLNTNINNNNNNNNNILLNNTNPINKDGLDKYNRHKGENLIIIGVLGNNNKGKSFILSKISKIKLLTGTSIETEGLSVKYPELKEYKGRQLILLDSAGLETPVLKKMNNPNEKNDDMEENQIEEELEKSKELEGKPELKDVNKNKEAGDKLNDKEIEQNKETYDGLFKNYKKNEKNSRNIDLDENYYSQYKEAKIHHELKLFNEYKDNNDKDKYSNMRKKKGNINAKSKKGE